MIKTKKWLGIIGLLILLVLMGSVIHGDVADAAREIVKLDYWAGPFGGTNYVTGFALLDTMNKTHPWLRASLVETKGSWDNALHMGENKARKPYSWCMTDYGTFTMSMTGFGKQMKGKKSVPKGDRKLLCTVMHAGNMVVTTDPKIKTGKDLKGKRMSGWTAGSGAWTTLEMMFKMWGINFNELKSYDGMKPKASCDALRDGLVDAIHLSEPYNPDNPNLTTGHFAELIASGKRIYRVPMPKEKYEPIAKEYLAIGAYPHLWKNLASGHWVKDWPGGGLNVVVGVFWVFKEMPEEIQYELAKTLIEKNDMVVAHGAQAALMVPSVLIGGLPIESEDQMAPGALKYYKESGVWNKYWKKK